MLQNINTIPWHTVKGAHGRFSQQVPVYLRWLVSPSSRKREEAYEYFYSHLVEQNCVGTVYEVTPEVIPFLMEWLHEKSVPERDQILDLLIVLYDGGSWDEDIYDHLSLSNQKRQAAEYQKRTDSQLTWLKQVQIRIEAGLDGYLALLQDPHAMVRLFTCSLLARFQKDEAVLQKMIPPLLECSVIDEDEQVRCNALSALVVLGALQKVQLEAFFKQNKDSFQKPSDMLKWTAARWLPKFEEQPDEDVFAFLIDMFEHHSELLQALREVPLLGDPFTLFRQIFSRAPHAIKEKVMEQQCQQMNHQSLYPHPFFHLYAKSLLELSLPNGYQNGMILTHCQKILIACIAQKALKGKNTFSDITLLDVLKEFHLPQDADKIQQLLGQEQFHLPIPQKKLVQKSKPWWRFW